MKTEGQSRELNREEIEALGKHLSAKAAADMAESRRLYEEGKIDDFFLKLSAGLLARGAQMAIPAVQGLITEGELFEEIESASVKFGAPSIGSGKPRQRGEDEGEYEWVR